MRKLMNILSSAVILTALGSCENTIDTIKVSGEDEIMMNALMDVNDDVHIVYLSHQALRHKGGASVLCQRAACSHGES